VSSADDREEKLLATIVLFEPRWQFCITFADKSDKLIYNYWILNQVQDDKEGWDESS